MEVPPLPRDDLDMAEMSVANPNRFVIRIGPRVGRAVPNAEAPGGLLIDLGVEQMVFDPDFECSIKGDGRLRVRQREGRRATIRMCVEGDPEWAARVGALTLPRGGGVFFGPGIAFVLSAKGLRRWWSMRRRRDLEARRLLDALGRR